MYAFKRKRLGSFQDVKATPSEEVQPRSVSDTKHILYSGKVFFVDDILYKTGDDTPKHTSVVYVRPVDRKLQKIF